MISDNRLVFLDQVAEDLQRLQVAAGALVSNGTAIFLDVVLVIVVAALEVLYGLFGRIEGIDPQARLCKTVAGRIFAANARIVAGSGTGFGNARG